MMKTMLSRLAIALFVWSLFLVAPHGVQAAEVSRASLLAQIQTLLEEVQRLQKLLEARTAALDPATYTPYKSVFFPLRFETMYLVKQGELHPLLGESNSEVADEELFTLFTDIVGEAAVSEYVKEWRVFENSSTDLGAFVELMAGTEDWIVGVNRESYDKTNPQIVEAYANLFVHEYAHIIFFETSEREDSFASRFWTVADYRHARAVEEASARDRFALMRRYYDNNERRFVGDYATMNVEEDMAESFVAFVREDKPAGTSLRDRKIKFFYEYDDFVTTRTELRSRLAALDVL